MAPGLVDDAATQRALVAHAGVRAIIDLWDRLDVALFGIGGPTWSAAQRRRRRRARARRRPGPSARSSSRRSISTAGSSARRCASGSSRSMRGGSAASRSRSASPPARARSGRSSARCGPASSERSSPTWRRPRPSSRLDERHRRTDRRGAAMTVREPAVLGHRPRHDRGQGGPGHSRRPAPRRSPGAATASTSAAATAGPSRIPGAWWSAVVGAVRALRVADLAEIVGDRRRRPRPDARRRRRARRGDPAGDHVPRHARHRRGRRAGARHRASAAGRSAACPAALWVERHEPAVAAATCWYLVDLGVAGLPPDRRRRRRRSSRTSSSPTRGVVAAAGIPADRLPPRSATGEVVGDLTGDGRRRARAARPASRSSAGPSTPSRATSAPACSSRATRYDPGGSAGGFGVYWDRPRRRARRRS